MSFRCLAVLAFSALAGCSLTPSASTMAGFYASTPVREDPSYYHSLNGENPVRTKEMVLSLYADGNYQAGTRSYSDGEPVRVSSMGEYDLQTNSTGVWRIEESKLILKPSTSPEESQADLHFKNGHWLIGWRQTEYLFRMNLPNKSPQSTTRSVTPTAGQEARQP
jgi:hypothetical protein